MDRQGIDPNDPVAMRLPFVGVENVESESGAFNFGNGSRIGNQRSTTFRFDERHVLYAKLRPYLNKVATPGFAGRCSTELVPLLPRNGVDREFIAYLLRRKETVEYVMTAVTGSRMPRTDMKALLSLPVSIPPLDEQRRIVGILNRAAKIERLQARAADCLQQFIPALFIKMFGDPMTNPMGWEVSPLGDVCISTQYGTSRKANNDTEGVPVLRMGNVTYDGHLDCAELKYALFSDTEIAKYALCAGDILFNRTNSKKLVGKTGMWDGRFAAVAASYFIRLRLDEARAYPSYVWAFMNSNAIKRWLFESARGAIGQANINAREIKSLPLPIPPLSLQRRYDQVVAVAHAAASISEAGSQSALALKDSLMSLLLKAST